MVLEERTRTSEERTSDATYPTEQARTAILEALAANDLDSVHHHLSASGLVSSREPRADIQPALQLLLEVTFRPEGLASPK